MKKSAGKLLSGIFLFLLTLLFLIYSDDCITLASQGLLIWYRNMIPTLFPFMVLSSLMIRTGFSRTVSRLMHSAFGRLLPFRKTSYFAIVMGFLCGFPMGAKAVAMQLSQRQIPLPEGRALLLFTNNIGPLYVFGYVFSLFPDVPPIPFFFCLYGIPLLYGSLYYAFSLRTTKAPKPSGESSFVPETLLQALAPSLQTAIDSITALGGCMVFFQVLQILPQSLVSWLPWQIRQIVQASLLPVIACLTEIGGGLTLLSETPHLFWMVPGLLILGGGSCLLQTKLLIRGTGLSLRHYLYQKLVQTALALLAGWVLLR